MSAKVSPASAIAASHASMVSDSGGTINRRPIFEMPIPVRADLSSNFSVVSMGRTCSAKRSGAISSAGRGAGSAPAIGRNNGNHTSSTCSKTTSTCWPSSSASKSLGSHPTMLVVSRTRGSSAIATWAITYGAGSPGRLNRSFSVNPASIALPETARTAMSRERQ